MTCELSRHFVTVTINLYYNDWGRDTCLSTDHKGPH